MASPPDAAVDSEDPRRVAHEVLGQAHAVYLIATSPQILKLWCREELLDDVLATKAEISAAIGQAHVAVGSGNHDEALLADGIGGPLGRPKRRMLRASLERLLRFTADVDGRMLNPLKEAASWGEKVVGSIAGSIPGGHAIAEALGFVVNAIESYSLRRPDSP